MRRCTDVFRDFLPSVRLHGALETFAQLPSQLEGLVKLIVRAAHSEEVRRHLPRAPAGKSGVQGFRGMNGVAWKEAVDISRSVYLSNCVRAAQILAGMSLHRGGSGRAA